MPLPHENPLPQRVTDRHSQLEQHTPVQEFAMDSARAIDQQARSLDFPMPLAHYLSNVEDLVRDVEVGSTNFLRLVLQASATVAPPSEHDHSLGAHNA